MTTTPKRTVLVTGCSDGGLGSHLCLAFQKAGWRVFATARNMAKLRTVTEMGIETIQLDTLSEESIASCVLEVEKQTNGSLDMLVNNAGAGYSMPLLDLDLARTRGLFDLNVFSLISTTRAFLPLLRKSVRSSSGGGIQGGIIVNNTTCGSLLAGAMPFAGGYTASKAAATHITEILRLELAPFGIKVVNLLTGGVCSSFQDNASFTPLPLDSIYNVAKETVEKAMAGEEMAAAGADPVQWATNIVKTLNKKSPPHWVWGGKWSTTVWLGSFLPIGTLDGVIKSMRGLDVVERKVREQEKTSKTKP